LNCELLVAIFCNFYLLDRTGDERKCLLTSNACDISAHIAAKLVERL